MVAFWFLLGPPQYYFWYFVLGIPALLFAVWAQMRVSSTFRRYSRVMARSGARGADAAQAVLAGASVGGVRIEPVRGMLSDHYDPRAKTLRLSEPVFSQRSLAALGVAAHEAGHAIQDARGYWPLTVRTAWVPLAQFGSSGGILLFMIGFLFHAPMLTTIGIVLFSFITLFTLVTVPVEFDASRRAVAALRSSGIVIGAEEEKAVRAVLLAAGLTYVAAAAQSIAQLLALILSTSGND